MSLGNQETPRSILAFGTSFCEDLIVKIFYGHSSSSAGSRTAVDLSVNGELCALSTGNLLRGGMPRNSVGRITDRPDMT